MSATTTTPDLNSDPAAQDRAQVIDATQKKFNDPYEFLATVAGAPSKEDLLAIKLRTPNNRLRVFSPDNGKRVFVLRAIGGAELSRLQEQLPQNMLAQKAEQEIQYLVGATCTVWANTSTGKITADDLRNGSAGLPSTIFGLVSWLSDFVDPEAFAVLSAEL